MVQRCKFSGEPICQILEEQTGERVGSFGSSGQGPGEFVAAEFIGKTEGDDTLYFVNLPSTVLLYARYALEHQSMSVLLSQYTPRLYLLNCESECNVEIFEMDDILKAKL